LFCSIRRQIRFTCFVFFNFSIVFLWIDVSNWCWSICSSWIVFLQNKKPSLHFAFGSIFTLGSFFMSASTWRWAPSACLRAAAESAISRDRRLIKRLITLNKKHELRVNQQQKNNVFLQPKKQCKTSNVEVSLWSELFHVCMCFGVRCCEFFFINGWIFTQFTNWIYVNIEDVLAKEKTFAREFTEKK